MIDTKDLIKGLQDKTLYADELSSWDWGLIPGHQQLSEDFIEEFSDKGNRPSWLSPALPEERPSIQQPSKNYTAKKTKHPDTGRTFPPCIFFLPESSRICFHTSYAGIENKAQEEGG